MGGTCGTYGGKGTLGRPRRRSDDNIKIDLKIYEKGGCGLDSSGSGQGKVKGCFKHGKKSS
jgi:hypothetical protein